MFPLEGRTSERPLPQPRQNKCFRLVKKKHSQQTLKNCLPKANKFVMLLYKNSSFFEVKIAMMHIKIIRNLPCIFHGFLKYVGKENDMGRCIAGGQIVISVMCIRVYVLTRHVVQRTNLNTVRNECKRAPN